MRQDQHQERSTTERHHIAHAVYGSIFRRAIWNTRGMRIDEEYLSRPHVTDDIPICADTPNELKANTAGALAKHRDIPTDNFGTCF